MTNNGNDQSSKLSPRGAWLFALVFWLAGLATIGVALGVIPVAPQDIHAPRWVLGAAGITFVASGFAPLAAYRGRSSNMSQIIAAGVALPLTLVSNWVAFGPGERQFSGGISIGFFAVSQQSSQLSGRIAFGIGAVLLDVLIVAIVVRRLRNKTSAGTIDGRPRPRSGRSSEGTMPEWLDETNNNQQESSGLSSTATGSSGITGGPPRSLRKPL